MKIYPDPELPDIEVSWYDGDCQPGSDNVVVTLDGIDDPTVHFEMTVPCTDAKLEFADVARERYRVTGTLVDAAGTLSGGGSQVTDLRNGISTTVPLFFGNVRVAFVFDTGVTCESLDAVFVEAWFTRDEQASGIAQSECEVGAMFTLVSPGTYTIDVRALDEDFRMIAASQTAEVEVAAEGLTNIGPLTLVPCNGSCPPP